MSSSIDPVYDLLGAMIAGTKAGTVAWEQGDSRARVFIAKTDDGTVTLTGSPARSLFGGNTVTVTLAVKNAQGKTIEEYETPPPDPIGAVVGIGAPAAIDRRVLELYEVVREQVTEAAATMRRLAAQFRKA